MQREGDDDVWRSIVENFGERAELDDGSAEPPASESDAQENGEAPAQEQPTDPYAWAVGRERDEPQELDEPGELFAAGRAEGRSDEDTFIPPEPPPLPIPEPDRGIAWLGVVGSPTILLLSLLTGLDFPRWVGYLMVAWFVGGFCYLVARMPNEPRDPWDDGSRV